MVFRKLAAAAALIAAATPAAAFDPGEQGTSTMFYISIPLDFRLPLEGAPWSAACCSQASAIIRGPHRQHDAQRFFAQ